MKASKGRVIRVSIEVYSMLEKKKKDFKSWDSLMRCAFGLPGRRKDKARKLEEFFAVFGSMKIFEKLSEARGEAIKLAVRYGEEFPEQPTKLREIL